MWCTESIFREIEMYMVEQERDSIRYLIGRENEVLDCLTDLRALLQPVLEAYDKNMAEKLDDDHGIGDVMGEIEADIEYHRNLLKTYEQQSRLV